MNQEGGAGQAGELVGGWASRDDPSVVGTVSVVMHHVPARHTRQRNEMVPHLGFVIETTGLPSLDY